MNAHAILKRHARWIEQLAVALEHERYTPRAIAAELGAEILSYIAAADSFMDAIAGDPHFSGSETLSDLARALMQLLLAADASDTERPTWSPNESGICVRAPHSGHNPLLSALEHLRSTFERTNKMIDRAATLLSRSYSEAELEDLAIRVEAARLRARDRAAA